MGPLSGTLVVDTSQGFAGAFAVSAGVVLTGAMAYAFVLGPVEPLVWPERPAPLRPAA